VNQRAKYLGQRSFCSSYYLDTHTHWRDCSTWTGPLNRSVINNRSHALADYKRHTVSGTEIFIPNEHAVVYCTHMAHYQVKRDNGMEISRSEL